MGAISNYKQRRDELEGYLQSRIPGACLELISPPQTPQLMLHLINRDYPRGGLSQDQAKALMDNPPYWAFCWASGQVMARFLLDNTAFVAGESVVDFGSGSGVVGIAAKMAGAASVTLCDSDPHALAVSDLNASLAGIEVDFSPSLESLTSSNCNHSIITVADVFYDRENLPLLEVMQKHFNTVLIADSRLKGQALPGMSIIGHYESHTVPDLDESVEFNRVTLYAN